MSKEFEDFKLWCKQNNLKENNYESLRLYNLITHLSEDVRMKKSNSYELLYAVEYIVAAVKEEEPGYMLEKLNQAKRYLDAAIRGVRNNV